MKFFLMLCFNVFRSTAIEMGELAAEVEVQVKPTLVDITFLAPKVKYSYSYSEVWAVESVAESLDVLYEGSLVMTFNKI
jgi:hypothetical protein